MAKTSVKVNVEMLNDLLASKNMKKAQLCRELKRSPNFISNIMRTGVASPTSIRIIEDYFGLTRNQLLWKPEMEKKAEAVVAGPVPDESEILDRICFHLEKQNEYLSDIAVNTSLMIQTLDNIAKTGTASDNNIALIREYAREMRQKVGG